jgi:hypothetical protein
MPILSDKEPQFSSFAPETIQDYSWKTMPGMCVDGRIAHGGAEQGHVRLTHVDWLSNAIQLLASEKIDVTLLDFSLPDGQDLKA